MQYLTGKVHSSAGTTNQADGLSAHDLKNDDLVMKFFSRAPSAASGGKASDQPKRTPVSQDEIDAVMVCRATEYL